MDIDTSDSVLTGDSGQASPNVQNSGCEGGVEVSSEHGEERDVGTSHLEQELSNPKDRQRAKSLSVYTDQTTIFEQICPETCRKRVQFADTLGLNLASVKHFSATEDPEIPSTVFSRLQSFPPQLDRAYVDDLCDRFTSSLNIDRFVPTFKMPVDFSGFDTRIQRLQVALEKVTVSNFDIRGLIRALTSGNSRKEVGVRYTFNDWLSFVDTQAIPTPGEDNAAVGEQFAFTLYTPPLLDASSSVHFAVYFRTDRGEFWDNNEGQNYTLKQHCISTESVASHGT
ncbi:protein phosphatase 1 regulatory subunit 3G-like [Megalops cyprinoides]|uniref:protein phosphatase 1 regulatory subunit 3G-like n=1 Tax=Megalops cyprinoides TaxID=118141 RepID=UPI001863B59E|nr:protein phosphatase 1 regulatory subunit 3G-like [Megalops cyprinoides]